MKKLKEMVSYTNEILKSKTENHEIEECKTLGELSMWGSRLVIRTYKSKVITPPYEVTVEWVEEGGMPLAVGSGHSIKDAKEACALDLLNIEVFKDMFSK
jgi:hypothetical protein